MDCITCSDAGSNASRERKWKKGLRTLSDASEGTAPPERGDRLSKSSSNRALNGATDIHGIEKSRSSCGTMNRDEAGRGFSADNSSEANV